MNRDSKLISRQNVEAVKKILKTADQWAAQGLDYAKRAEPLRDLDRAIVFLTRAATSFENAEDADLLRKADAHIESLHLRKKIYFRQDQTSLSEILEEDETRSFEQVSVDVLAKLAEESLLVEANRFFRAVSPLLGDFAREKLQQRLIPLLPEIEDSD